MQPKFGADDRIAGAELRLDEVGDDEAEEARLERALSALPSQGLPTSSLLRASLYQTTTCRLLLLLSLKRGQKLFGNADIPACEQQEY